MGLTAYMRDKFDQMTKPVVSIVVPTRNSSKFLENCLRSIKDQTYEHIELIVVDNYSTDNTKTIAEGYTRKVFSKGPERTAQRNYAAIKATGKYLLFIDSDMELGPKVVEQCVATITQDTNVSGVAIHEESFGDNFWARCKALERSFYVNVTWIEAARFFQAKTFHELGGYNESLVSGEDWDLSKRVEKKGIITSVPDLIRHNEGHISLSNILKKKYYYAQHAAAYLAANPELSILGAKVGPINRYKLFLSQPGKLFRNPVLGICMLFMKTSEFAAGAIGLLSLQKIDQKTDSK